MTYDVADVFEDPGVRTAIAAFAVQELIVLFRHLAQHRIIALNPEKEFITPYRRIYPMHITLHVMMMLSLSGISVSGFFVCLVVAADIAGTVIDER